MEFLSQPHLETLKVNVFSWPRTFTGIYQWILSGISHRKTNPTLDLVWVGLIANWLLGLIFDDIIFNSAVVRVVKEFDFFYDEFDSSELDGVSLN